MSTNPSSSSTSTSTSATTLTPQALGTTKLYTPRASIYDSSWHPLHASAVLSSSPPSPGAHVLDLCTGTGLVALACARMVGPHGSVTAVDATEAMLDVARGKETKEKEEEEKNEDGVKQGQKKNNEKEKKVVPVKWMLGDVTQLAGLLGVPLPISGSVSDVEIQFDLIVCLSALPLLDDPHEAIKHWSTYLAPNGRMVLDFITERHDRPGLLFEAIAAELDVPIPWRRSWVKDYSSLERAVRDAGLDIEKSFVAKGFGSAKQYGGEEGGQLFDGFMAEGKAAGEGFRGNEMAMKKGRRMFVERWKAMAGEEDGGRVQDEEGFYVVVGRKRR